jgi:hypothetical protein
MKASRYSGAQKAFILKQGVDGVSVADTIIEWTKNAGHQINDINTANKKDALATTMNKYLNLPKKNPYNYCLINLFDNNF